jgi:hypothetical protein
MGINSDVNIYVTGILQGSKDKAFFPQDYRKKLVEAIKKSWQTTTVYSPTINTDVENPESLKEAVKQFEQQLAILKKANIVVAYIPEAGMGCAIEIYNAAMRGKYVVTITPLKQNRVIRMFSHDIYDSIESFTEACKVGKFKKDFARFVIDKSKRTTSIAPRYNVPLKKHPYDKKK